ncbi:hypothetical protein EVS84_20310 [Pseudomonas koreensis]|uniref:Uncharacterized protein n=1 Tax=Pseudomonas koreensis TaxID=198620 RepID=A0A4Q4L1J4_9PSED|nr:hypothetical protein EVS84_20310 [Pseudomonas koreensis]
MIVPTLCVGIPLGTLRVPWDAERPRLHSHAERGYDRTISKRHYFARGNDQWCAAFGHRFLQARE